MFAFIFNFLAFVLVTNHDKRDSFPANTYLVIYKTFDKNKWCPEPILSRLRLSRQPSRSSLALLGALGRAALRLLQTTTLRVASEKALKLLYIKFFDKNKWCPEPESNQRHVDFQSTALPTELSGQVLIFILNCKWRRRRDSNPRAAKITTYTLSRGTSSTDLSTSPRFKLFCESCDTYVKRINR